MTMNKQNIKGECYVYRGYEQRNKVSFAYLKCKL